MHLAEYSGQFLKSPEAIALRLKNDPRWLDGVGSLEVFAEDCARITPTNEIQYSHDYSGTRILRLSYTDCGVLITSIGRVPDSFIKAFASLNPHNTPFKDGHFSKCFCPDAVGETLVNYVTLSSHGEPVITRIPDNGSFTIEAVDLVGSKTNMRIAATVLDPKRNGEHKVYLLENSEQLGHKTDFVPVWGEAPWSKDCDVRSHEGFTNRIGGVLDLFIDAKTRFLMAAVNNDKPQKVLENATVLFRTATGAEVDQNHIATVATTDALVELFLSDAKTLVLGRNVWKGDVNLDLLPLLESAKGMKNPEGILGPHGFFICDAGRSQVLTHQISPKNLRI
jgi:hypothetical protein